MSGVFGEAEVEAAALAWLRGLGWTVVPGPSIAPGEPGAERTSYREVVLVGRLRSALARLNPGLPAEALERAERAFLAPEGFDLPARNRSLHRALVEGVGVEFTGADGRRTSRQVRGLDFERLDANDWLAVNQFTVLDNRRRRRVDVALFVNGLPLGVLELKHAADESATLDRAFRQLETYQREIPKLFEANAVLVVSDGLKARVGALGAGWEWFKPWRTLSGEEDADPRLPELRVLLGGVCARGYLLELVRDFTVFEDEGGGRLTKKVAGYHQFHAVRVAVEQTLRALAPDPESAVAEAPGRYASGAEGGEPGDKRVGVVWHTQGSGKSLTMAFYAGRISRERALENPTVVVLTDRNDLDEQLFQTFARCRDLLRQDPVRARHRAHLRELLAVEAGGVVFTTIQKFFPDEKGDRHPRLSARRNVIVLADEAHRSQYELVDGFAAHLRDALPGASFIGFTGTPIEKADANTRAIFGDYISVYDLERAVADGATVPIYYEARLAELALDEAQRPHLDAEFEEVTEGEEVERKERLKTKWAQLEAVVGAAPRLELVARDLVEHFERRLEAIDGKAMVVCMSRRIAVALYEEIARLRPAWHDEDDARGAMKIVMTGDAADPASWQGHIRNRVRRDELAQRFRKPDDPFRLVIVRDMWLTGFDAPCLHTLYVDKPMRAHGLMQAIARVNRVFRDKPGGLVVDYLGLAHELSKAVTTYTEAGGKGSYRNDPALAVRALEEQHEVLVALLFGCDWTDWRTVDAAARTEIFAAVQAHLVTPEPVPPGAEPGPSRQDRFLAAVRAMSQAFALCSTRPEAQRLRDDLTFFQLVQGSLAKPLPGEARQDEALDHAVRQLLSQAVVPGGVVDLFATAGLARPDLSILSEEFLAEVQGLPRRNLAVELLQRLLRGQLRTRSRRNVVQARSFSEMLENALRRYRNRSIEAAQMIEELIALAREMRAAQARGEALGLSEEELAFYDALETNDSAVAVLGDAALRQIARELLEAVRRNVTTDWTVRENVRAQLRTLVKRILRKHGYPPDKQEKATQTVLEQAEVLSAEWAEG